MMARERLLPELLAVRADTAPDQKALIFVDGPEWSWADVLHHTRRHAAALGALGVERGDLVLSWMPNGPIAVLNLLALASLGAVYVPINTAYRGGVLAHVLGNSNARLMIAHGALVERLADIDRAALETLVVIGPERPAFTGIEVLGQDVLEASEPSPSDIDPFAGVHPWELAMVIYTSGTTGPSKGVLSSHRHLIAGAAGFSNVGPGDRNLTALPMFHVGGVWGVVWAILHGGSAVIADGFRTQDFWPIVKRYGITTTGLLGAMVEFLNAQPAALDDRDHSLCSVIIAPYATQAIRFADRFGVNVYTEFNMSELAVPLFAGPDPGIPGTCGTPASGVTLRIVDSHDEEVAEGETGELILRMDQPWAISHGYHGDAAATAEAWRNGWFHTGDVFRRDARGHYFFVDRLKDSIRRRGENISSFEVESALLQHPSIVEAVAVGVPAPGGSEQEVMAVIRVAEGEALAPEDLIAFLETRIAHFMIPRFVREVTDFPRTPTQKVEKHVLRSQGVTFDCWDREMAGVTVTRARLEQRG